MPRQRRNNDNEYRPPTFVESRFSAEQMKKFKAYNAEQEPEFDEHITALVREGWKVSVRYDSENLCSVSAATFWSPGAKNHNVCVTSRAATAHEALWMACYKILVLYADADLRELARETMLG